MSDRVLPYYDRELEALRASELDFIRQLAADFSTEHPKIAARLQLGPEGSRDPHVERLIMAFAFLNARTRLKLDDDLPELAEAMLNVLYPHYLSPIPSMSMVSFRLRPDSAADMINGYQIPRGTMLETPSVNGISCHFRTAYDLNLLPFAASTAQFTDPPYPVPPSSKSSVEGDAKAILHIRFTTDSKDVPFGILPMESLRCYLHGDPERSYELFEFIHNEVTEIRVVGAAGEEPLLLGADALRPVGFGRDEGLLPYTDRSLLAYRYLTEYFVFPKKFLYLDLDLTKIPAERRKKWGRDLDVYFLFRKFSRDLRRTVTAETFQCGATPVVNLFPKTADPITITQRESEYRIVADARQEMAYEVYSVDHVEATSPQRQRVEYVPFFSLKHHSDANRQKTYWQAIRVAAEREGPSIDRGTEVHLRFVDLNFSPVTGVSNWRADIKTTCLNRDIPASLPFGGGQPELQPQVGAEVATVMCLTKPTETLRPPLRRGTLWRIVSHLNLNHVAVSQTAQGAEAFREMLRLYNFGESETVDRMINGLLAIECRTKTARVGIGSHSSVCRGNEVILRVNEDAFKGFGMYLLGTVLDAFLAQFVSINSFTQLTLTSDKREGVIKQWAPKSGEKPVL